MTDLEVVLGGTRVRIVRMESGGEAEVCRVVGHQGVAVKLYRDALSPERERKLRHMVAAGYPLTGRGTASQHPPELAWPTALVHHTTDGRVLGYAMRQLSVPEHLPLFTLFTRAQRRRFFPERDWKFLLGVAWNLAYVTELVHRSGLVVGDFSCANIVLDADGFVTFLDCDSMALTVPATGEVHTAEMFTADYAPPERRTGLPASVASDDFALAILVYRLLTAGNHPFTGFRQDAGDTESAIDDNIRAGCSHVVYPERVHTSRTVLDPTWCLSPSLLHLARRAFGAGVADPVARPTAREWLLALNDQRDRVRRCTVLPRHRHPAHLRACPWCALARTGRDPFNPPDTRPAPGPAPAPAGTDQPAPAAQPTTRTAPAAAPPPAPANSRSQELSTGEFVLALLLLLGVVAAVVAGVVLLVVWVF